MRLSSRFLAIALCLFLVCASFAQGGGGRQRGGRQRGFGLFQIIFRADVQTDLAVTSDEKTKLDSLRESFRPQRGAGGGAGGGGGATQPTAEERMTREQDQAKQIDAVLTPDQSKRLREIQIQLEGAEAVARPNVQTDLGLSSTQVSQIKDLMKSYGDANRSIMEKRRNNEIDREAAGTEMTKNRDTLKDNLTKVLTPEQATKLKDMGGKPFAVDVSPNGA